MWFHLIDKKYCKVRDYGHYKGKYWGTTHSVCNVGLNPIQDGFFFGLLMGGGQKGPPP